MQLRCYHCHKPFAISQEQIHLTLDELTEKELHHYNAVCPHCRRTNRVSQKELFRAAPEWVRRSEKGNEEK